ncbi:MAG: ribonuclease P protein component [Candidatus Eisenbacteria bacterium]
MAWGDEPLRSKESIRRLFDEGEAFHGRHLVLIARREIEGPRMVLFVASRRVGNAVRRNRAKRAMRAAYQVLAERLTESGWHLGWIARPSCAEKGMRAIETEMEDLLQRAGLHAGSAEILGGGREPQDHRT